MSLTPIQLEYLLHCHYEAFYKPAFPSEVISGQFNRLEFLKLIEKDKNGFYSTTQKGKAYVKAACDLPMPVETWAVPGFEDSEL